MQWIARWPTAILAAIFVCGMAAIELTYLIRIYSPVTFYDSWDVVTIDQIVSRLFWHHNEHRITLPAIVLLIDTLLFHAGNVFPIISTHVFILALSFVIGCWARSAIHGSRTDLFIATAVTFGLLVCLRNNNILEWSFMCSWPMVYFFAALCYVAYFDWNDTTWRPWSFPAIYIFSLAASLCMANGILSLVPLIIIAVLNGKTTDARRLSIWTVVLIFFYFVGRQPSIDGPSEVGVIWRAIEAAKFFIIWLGAYPGELLFYALNLAAPDPLGMGQAGIDLRYPGAAGLLVGSATLLILFDQLRRNLNRTTGGLVAFSLFALISGAAMAFGRARYGLAGASASRLGFVSLLLLISVTILGWNSIRDRVAAVARERLIFGGVCALVLTGLTYQVHVTNREHDWSNLRKLAAAALISGVDDIETIGLLYPPDPTKFYQLVELARTDRLGIFAPGIGFELLGKTIVAKIDASRCEGSFEEVVKDVIGTRPGTRVKGWAAAPEHVLSTAKILLADAGSRVVGFGFTGYRRPDVLEQRPTITTSLPGWFGYINQSAQKPISAFVVLDGGRTLCPIAKLAPI